MHELTKTGMASDLRAPKQEAFCFTVSSPSAGQWEGGQAAFTHETHSCWPSSTKLLSFCPCCLTYSELYRFPASTSSFLPSSAAEQTKDLVMFHL